MAGPGFEGRPVASVMIQMQEKINLMNAEGLVTRPELAEHPPHRDSDLVTTLQWLHLQIQHMDESQAAVAPSTADSRSQRRVVQNHLILLMVQKSW